MLRWIDGFDFYPTSDLPLRYNEADTAHSFVISSGGRFGSGCVTLAPSLGTSSLTKYLDDQATWVVGFAFRMTSVPPATMRPILKLLDGPTDQVVLNVDPNGRLAITVGGTTLAAGTTSLLTSTYYYIEFKATIDNASGSASCRIGGSAECGATGVATRQTGNSSANRFQLAAHADFNGGSFDDLYVLDGQTSGAHDFLGDMRVETLYPSGDGVHGDFAVTGAASGHAAVAEHPEDGDTSYIASSTPGQKSSFSYTDLSSTPTSIAGVQLNVVGRKDDAGSRSLASLVVAGGVDYDLPALPVYDSYSHAVAVLEENPATGAAWTAGDVNALEAGVTLVS
jgi:hypothetical protein